MSYVGLFSRERDGGIIIYTNPIATPATDVERIQTSLPQSRYRSILAHSPLSLSPLHPQSSLITRLHHLVPLRPHRPIGRQPRIPALTILPIGRNPISRQRRARRLKRGALIVTGRELATSARSAGHGDGVCVWVRGARAGGHAVVAAPDGHLDVVVAVECVGDVILARVEGGGEGQRGGEEEGD